jgi:hypothetical protein
LRKAGVGRRVISCRGHRLRPSEVALGLAAQRLRPCADLPSAAPPPSRPLPPPAQPTCTSVRTRLMPPCAARCAQMASMPGCPTYSGPGRSRPTKLWWGGGSTHTGCVQVHVSLAMHASRPFPALAQAAHPTLSVPLGTCPGAHALRLLTPRPRRHCSGRCCQPLRPRSRRCRRHRCCCPLHGPRPRPLLWG